MHNQTRMKPHLPTLLHRPRHAYIVHFILILTHANQENSNFLTVIPTLPTFFAIFLDTIMTSIHSLPPSISVENMNQTFTATPTQQSSTQSSTHLCNIRRLSWFRKQNYTAQITIAKLHRSNYNCSMNHMNTYTQIKKIKDININTITAITPILLQWFIVQTYRGSDKHVA